MLKLPELVEHFTPIFDKLKGMSVLKKTITYEDFNGDTVSEDFFFHLSKAELIELEMSHEGGLSASLQRIVDAKDGKGIIEEFKNIILSAYGKRSEDGKRFVKNQLLREEFESTEAYSALFVELVTDTDAAVEFINGVVPANMIEEAAKLASTDLKVVEEPTSELPPRMDNTTLVTRADIAKMSPDEINQLSDRVAAGEVKLVD
jgi:hypothetical protein